MVNFGKIRGGNCPKCSIDNNKVSKEEFIKRAIVLYDDKYDYTNMNFVNMRTKTTIICHKHGEISIIPSVFLTGVGCRKCGYENSSLKRKTNKDELLTRFKLIHGDKYTYYITDYTNQYDLIDIECKIHGLFRQTIELHLRGSGCPICGRIKAQNNTVKSEDSFLNISNKVHNNYYDYKNVNYINRKTKVEIICPKHGSFWQTPNAHINGHGCPSCGELTSHLKHSRGLDNFINESVKIHQNKYDYSKSAYVTGNIKVEIICPKHGSFWQTPNAHINGQGCPNCNSSLGEEKIINWLQEHNIEYNHRYRFDDCKYKRKLEFDFYIPFKNLCIEYDGKGHFSPVNWSGHMTEEEMNENFEKYKLRDSIKDKYCKDNNINLLRIPYTEFESIEEKLNFYLNKNNK